MDTKFELKNHIIYEFYAGSPNKENILFETRGVVNGLNQVVKAICEKIEPQAKRTCSSGKDITKAYIGTLSKIGLSSFFDKYSIIITTEYSAGNNKYAGGFYPIRSLYDTNKGVVCSPEISLSVSGMDPDDIMNIIRFAIGHELTHAYNLVKYARKTGSNVQEVMDNYLYKQHYRDIKHVTNSRTGNAKAVGNILYNLNRMERNAYLAQLKQELEAKSDAIKDSKSAWQAVLDSESYKKFKNLEKNISIMCGFVSDDVKDEILKATNDITGKNFKNYEQVKKYYVAYWNVWKKKYLSTAAKIAYDVFDENNVMVDGYPNEEFVLKNK